MPSTNRPTAPPENGCITIKGPHGYVRLSPSCARKVAGALQRAVRSLDGGGPHAMIDVGVSESPAVNAEATCDTVSEGGAA